MARKSRRTEAEPQVVERPAPQLFPTAIYARLSVENSGKSEKIDVIQNQIDICMEYVKSCPYLELVDTYADNGRTGTVFDRPEFNRLMDDIRVGRIKCLVVRDLSRFGRDYIETGTYLERIFPQIGFRFIAIKEHYDSFDTDGSEESLIIPLQNMINALYSKTSPARFRPLFAPKWNREPSAKGICPMGTDGTRITPTWSLMREPPRL